VRRNLCNRLYRNIGVIVAYAVIAATIFSAQYLVIGSQQSLDKGTRWIGADLMVVPEEYTTTGENILLTGSPTTFFFNDSGMEKISRIHGVANASSQIYIATLLASCCSAPIQIIAIDPDRDFTISAWLKENPGVTFSKDDIIVGSNIEGDVGSGLMFYGHIFHIAGKLEQTGMRGIDMAVFIRIEDAYVMASESGDKAVKNLTIPAGAVSTVLVKVNPGVSPAGVGTEIGMQFPGMKTITPNSLSGTVTGHIEGVIRLLYQLMLAAAVIFIILFGLFSVIVAHELRREIRLLGALGVTKAFLIRLLFAESFILSIIGALVGIGSALIVLISFQDLIVYSLRIPFGIPSIPTLLITGGTALFGTILIGVLASIYPTIRLIQSEAYKTIQEEK
jgi:putative ABC transport system permease protein